VFKIIVNSVPITNFPGLFDLAPFDRWEGYPAQRTQLLDFLIQNKIPGVLFVSGDFHLGASTRVEPTGPWSPFREVLMGPGDQNANPLWLTLPGAPQFDFKTGTSNVTVFEADPNAVPPTLTMKFIAADGSTLHTQTLTY
jgi:alkaline phosphatase D